MKDVKKIWEMIFQDPNAESVLYDWRSLNVFKQWLTRPTSPYWHDKLPVIALNETQYNPETVIFIAEKLYKLINNPPKLIGEHMPGVSFCRATKKFMARVRMDGKSVLLGRFDTDVKAHKAWRSHFVSQLESFINDHQDPRINDLIRYHVDKLKSAPVTREPRPPLKKLPILKSSDDSVRTIWRVIACKGTVWQGLRQFREWLDMNGYEPHLTVALLPHQKKYGPDTAVVCDREVAYLMKQPRDRLLSRQPCGVAHDTYNKVFKARDMYEGKPQFIGSFKTAMEAHKAWQEARAARLERIAALQTDKRVIDVLIGRAAQLRYEAAFGLVTTSL